MVVGDDADRAMTEAAALATELWERREEFGFVAPTGSLEEVMEAALASQVTPYFVSDSGDNPTAGGAGDVTWTLAELLASEELAASGRRAIYASIPDAMGALAASEAGVGADVRLTLGARVDARPAPPVEVAGEVVAVVPSDDNLEVVVRTADGRRDRHPPAPALPPRAGLHPARPGPAQRRRRRGQDRLPRARALRHGRRLDARAHPGWRGPGPGAPRSPSAPAPDVPPRRRQRRRPARGRRAVPRRHRRGYLPRADITSASTSALVTLRRPSS